MAQVTIKGLDVLKKIEDQAKESVGEQLEDYFTELWLMMLSICLLCGLVPT